MSRDPGQTMRRSIGIVFADGGFLTLSGSAPADGGGHGDEPLVAVLCEVDAAPLVFEEALLSTEFGEDGVQRRATLELWLDTEDGRPLRGAGTLINSIAAAADGLETRIAFFRWAIEGREGLGHYEIARARG
jgi:hypothetical protein